jgi:hypothetical protein
VSKSLSRQVRRPYNELLSENGQKSYDLNERLILLGFERGALYFPKRDFRTRRERANRNRGKIERKQVRGRAKIERGARQIFEGEMREALYLLGFVRVSLLRMDFRKIETPYLSGGGEKGNRKVEIERGRTYCLE